MIKKTLCFFLASALLFSCKKEESAPAPVKPTPPVTPTPTPTPGSEINNLYIYATIDGTSWNVKHALNGYLFGTGHSMSHVSNGDALLDYITTFNFDAAAPNATELSMNLSVGLSHFFQNLGPYWNDNAIFDSHFTLGSKSYFVDGSNTPGAEISYYDEINNKLWSTKFGDQTGSTYNLSSAVNTTLNGPPGKLCKATFSCKIYLEGTILYKTITSGSYYVIFDKY